MVLYVSTEGNAMKNWKTSLAGLGAAMLNLFANGHGWKEILVSAGFAALGLVSKDHDVTGN